MKKLLLLLAYLSFSFSSMSCSPIETNTEQDLSLYLTGDLVDEPCEPDDE